MKTRAAILTLATAAALAGCAAQRPTEFHTLMSAPQASPSAGAALRFRIDPPVRVPPQVDQPQIVLRQPDGSLQVLEQQRWAAPLADEWRDALSEGLSHALQALDVSRIPAPPGPQPYALQLELQRFDSEAGGQAVQQVRWSVTRPGDAAPALSCSTQRVETTGADVSNVVAAHRRAVARLAGTIATVIEKLQEGRPADCP